MKKHIYISSDYSEDNGDREVVKALKTWGYDNRYKVEFLDMAEVVSGSVSENNPDCRPCDLKREFNQQINASSSVIFVVGDKTADRKAGPNQTVVVLHINKMPTVLKIAKLLLLPLLKRM